jgi:hypothetical protein
MVTGGMSGLAVGVLFYAVLWKIRLGRASDED